MPRANGNSQKQNKSSRSKKACSAEQSSLEAKKVFIESERIASEYTLTRQVPPIWLSKPQLSGLLSAQEIDQQIRTLQNMSVDDYIHHTISPSENTKRTSAPEVIAQMDCKIIRELNEGPLYLAEAEFQPPHRRRRVVFLAQNRNRNKGVWKPCHHRFANEWMQFYSAHSIPVVAMVDTPGAEANEEANLDNQAHAISALIERMINLPQPTVGIILGNGYSGGAIPLAATNLLLSVRDGVFNTIHPTGLSEIAYNHNLSWQECAKYAGVSAYELYKFGYLDGVIDYSPSDNQPLNALQDAILAALDFVETQAHQFLSQDENHYFFEHYKHNILNYLSPSRLLVEDNLNDSIGNKKTPSGRLNVFGAVFRFHRHLRLRVRLRTTSLRRYSRVTTQIKTPAGELRDRLDKVRKQRFENWLQNPLELRYENDLMESYRRFVESFKTRKDAPNVISSLLMGSPQQRYERNIKRFSMLLSLHLFNVWKMDAADNFSHLLEILKETPCKPPVPATEASVMSSLYIKEIQECLPEFIHNLMLFDRLYDKILENLTSIASELKDTNHITQETLASLLDKTFGQVQGSIKGPAIKDNDCREKFFQFLSQLTQMRQAEPFIRQISGWKRTVYPRVSEPLFAIVSYMFTHLLPEFYRSQRENSVFNGRINPRNIGIKDFWHRLNKTYRDMLIQNLLSEYKKEHRLHPQEVIDTLFTNFEELHKNLITADPHQFPGYRQSIEKSLKADIPPVGIVTGIANFDYQGFKTLVGVVVSNTLFQAGAFDMASCEKICRLMLDCAERKLPLVMLISSGGMQVKEGAGSLFSMAILNNRISRFVKDFDLPILCFGFRDCTGGVQASFVTHPLVKTFYLSGAVIPFAGQRVVPSYLTAESTLANYLSRNPISMNNLVINPFDPDLDKRLRNIDSNIPIPTESISQAIKRVLEGEYKPRQPDLSQETAPLPKDYIKFSPVRNLLIHARGTTAVRLIEGAHAAKINVLLVQSDADMESLPARMLKKSDCLVCLGGNTPQESYLNGMSVIRIAEQEKADAIHPGIGFLSENPDFAWLCRKHGLNFIGPGAKSMELMGNKSNAIATANHLKIPVAPGSMGVIDSSEKAQIIAKEIGYPVLMKAAFGGGGKGICLVENSEELKDAFLRTSQQALSAFGNGDIYMEHFVSSIRHVEVQVLRDGKGNTCILGIRDCSVQRQKQKLIEESGSPLLKPELIKRLITDSERIADEVNYIGAGTVEFIHDLKRDTAYFMEMNTRLQVEHPVTEMVSEVDIVVEQIRIAAGKSIANLKPKNNGYAMEVRINAEQLILTNDNKLHFKPSPGKITFLRLPEDPNLRILSAAEENDTIPPYYDSLIIQIIAHGPDRKTVIDTLLKGLQNTHIEGIYTNISLMEAILADKTFRKGIYDTNYLEKFFEKADIKAIINDAEQRHSTNIGNIDIKSISISNSEELKVLSPRTGIFYGSPSPEEPPFVKLHTLIDTSQPLGLIEAMKVFEPLTLNDFNQSGQDIFPQHQKFELRKIMVESGQTINQGDLLFIVKPVTS